MTADVPDERVPSILSPEERALLLRIARCPLIPLALGNPSHRCHRVVATQTVPSDDRQVPEGWAGNLRGARIVFLSSNPSISLAGDDQPADEVEPYPAASSSDDDIAHFLGRRFDQTVTPQPFVTNSRSLLRNGRYAERVTTTWNEIRNRANELLSNEADPARNYVMTEVVHCKSRQNRGADRASDTCADLYLDEIMRLTAAPIVAVVGQVAQRYIRRRFPQLPEPPAIHPQAELGRRLRTFLFIGQPGSHDDRVIGRLYEPRMAELIALAAGG
jgi:hypothetical protein